MRTKPLTYKEFDAVMRKHKIPFHYSQVVEGAGKMNEYTIEGKIVACFSECVDAPTATEIWNAGLKRAFDSYSESGKRNKPLYYSGDNMKMIVFPRPEEGYAEHTIVFNNIALTILCHDDYLEETKQILSELSLLMPLKSA